MYKDPDTLFHWEIVDNTDSIICGYHCSKAQYVVSGNTWSAWYSPEIPISDGPYKFTGLPGLITVVYDGSGKFRLELYYFQQREISLPIVNTNDAIAISKSSYIKHKKDFMDNFLDYMKGKFTVTKDPKTGETIEQQWAKRPIGMDELF